MLFGGKFQRRVRMRKSVLLISIGFVVALHCDNSIARPSDVRHPPVRKAPSSPLSWTFGAQRLSASKTGTPENPRVEMSFGVTNKITRISFDRSYVYVGRYRLNLTK